MEVIFRDTMHTRIRCILLSMCLTTRRVHVLHFVGAGHECAKCRQRSTGETVGEPEETYWIGTESGLLGAFHFDGACTVGDGSCDVVSLSMGTGFCNIRSLKWLVGESLTPTRLENQRTKQSYKVGREEEGMSSNRPELVALWGGSWGMSRVTSSPRELVISHGQ